MKVADDWPVASRPRFVPGGRACGFVVAAVLASLVVTCDESDEPVTPVMPTSITVTPGTVALEALGDTAWLVARVLDQNGVVMSGAVVSWSSGDSAVAMVNAGGLVTAVGNGAAFVTAKAGSVTGQAQVVVDQRVDSVVVTPDSLEFFALGGEALLVAEAIDPNGAVVSGAAVSWSSADESVATVSVSGLVTAAGEGTTAVAASVEGRRGSAEVAVSDPDWVALVAFYNSTNGPAWDDNTNWLSSAPRDQWYGVDTNADGRVSSIELGGNGLTGSLPGELGSLSSLENLSIRGDERLTGSIPDELGSLPSLKHLRLTSNGLTGPIPPELGDLAGLELLYLFGNSLTGPIPSELGNLRSLLWLALPGNALTGPIPPELGDLSNLEVLELGNNYLTGPIPGDLGDLSSLEGLYLRGNLLRGPMSDELTSLVSLEDLWVDRTVCVPRTPAFESWLNGIRETNVVYCYVAPPVNKTTAYVMQAVPGTGHDVVPLIAGKPGLLRVFVTANNPDSVGMPRVRATFYADGIAVHTADIPARPNSPIPLTVDEGDFANTANAEIPGAVVTPGLEMVIEIDPDRTLSSSVDLVNRIPETGRILLDVGPLNVFDLTVIPFLFKPDPDSTLLDLTNELEPDHELFGLTRKLLPIAGMEVTVHDPVRTSSGNSLNLLREVKAIRVAEGGRGYWMGMMNRNLGGRAFVGGRDSFSEPDPSIIAHELGHNFSLLHPPGCRAMLTDPRYPYRDGAIGVWGWDPIAMTLVDPLTPDVMSYCGPPDWISDYHFSKAFFHRTWRGAPKSSPVLAASQRTLLLWGGTEADGKVFLNPAFVVDALPSLPEADGGYRVTGEAEDGSVLFSLDFDMEEIADGDGGSGFAFALPVAPSWAGTLARITLTGGGSSSTLGREGNEAAVLLRDPATGKVRGLLLDVPTDPGVRAEWLNVLRTGNMDVQISRGVPEAGVWQR